MAYKHAKNQGRELSMVRPIVGLIERVETGKRRADKETDTTDRITFSLNRSVIIADGGIGTA